MKKFLSSVFSITGALLLLAFVIASSTKTNSQTKGKKPETVNKLKIASSEKQPDKVIINSDSMQKALQQEVIEIRKDLQKDDKKDAYIATLEKQVKWGENYIAKLRAENSRITLLMDKRPKGDTLALVFTTENFTDFIQHIADSIMASLPPTDTLVKERYGPLYNRKTRFVKMKSQ